MDINLEGISTGSTSNINTAIQTVGVNHQAGSPDLAQSGSGAKH